MDSVPSLRFPLIQVAGVHDLDEARDVISAGADLVGIPLRLPVHSEDLDEPGARKISRALPGRCCLITYLSEADEIINLATFLQIPWVQLHGDISVASLRNARAALPGVRIIKSLIVGKEPETRLLEQARALAPWTDVFITDTWDPQSGAEGATGRAHDWAVSRRLCEGIGKPLILAGGLNPENVAGAIRATGCHGVDAHTGLEGADGRKCPRRLHRFVSEARAAFA